MAQAKFKVGDHVNHPACPNHSFPAGTGTITEALPCDQGGECKYKVQCDKTGQVLPVEFKECDLSAV